MSAVPCNFWLKHRQIEGGTRMSWGHFFLCPTSGVTYSSAEPLSPQKVVLSGYCLCSMTYCIAQAPSLTPSGLGMLEKHSSPRLGVHTTCLCWKTFYCFSVFIIIALFKLFMSWFSFDTSYIFRNVSKISIFSTVLKYKFSKDFLMIF